MLRNNSNKQLHSRVVDGKILFLITWNGVKYLFQPQGWYISYVRYSAKRWLRKTLANPIEDCIGKKILVNTSLTSNETLLAKMVRIIDMFVM